MMQPSLAASVIPTALVLGSISARTVAAATAEPAIQDQLLAIKHRQTCEVTTIGRRTGNPHTVTVWFTVEGDTIYLSTLDASRDWVRNAIATPQVTIDFGDLTVRGTFHEVTQAELDDHVIESLRNKYWLAWIGGWLRQRPERSFRVDELRLVDS